MAVIHLICESQISERNLSPTEFAKLLPQPPDPLLEAIKEAVIDFFPSGRASHVREVLTKFDEMASKADEIVLAKIKKMQPQIIEKMTQKADDPRLMEAFSEAADENWDEAMKKVFPHLSEPGT